MRNKDEITAKIQRAQYMAEQSGNPALVASLKQLEHLIFDHEKKSKLSKRVAEYLKPNYWPETGPVLEELGRIIESAGYDAAGLQETMIMEDSPVNIPLGNKAYICLSFHRMESGRWEIVGYIN